MQAQKSDHAAVTKRYDLQMDSVLEYDCGSSASTGAVFSLAFASVVQQSSSKVAGYPDDFKIAASSLVETVGAENEITVLGVEAAAPASPSNGDHYASLPDDMDMHMSTGSSRVSSPRPQAALCTLARASHPYPCTKLAFAPSKLRSTLAANQDMLATTCDCLRIWDLTESLEGSGSSFVGQGRKASRWQLQQRSSLANASLSVLLTIVSDDI